MTFEYNYSDQILKVETSLKEIIPLDRVRAVDLILTSLTRPVAVIHEAPISYEITLPIEADMYEVEIRYEMLGGEVVNEFERILIIPIPSNPTPIQRVILFAVNNLNLDSLELEEKLAIVNFLKS